MAKSTSLPIRWSETRRRLIARRRPWSKAILSLALLAGTAASVLMAAAGLPFPLEETTPVDVIVVANLPGLESAAALPDVLAQVLATRGVASMELVVDSATLSGLLDRAAIERLGARVTISTDRYPLKVTHELDSILSRTDAERERLVLLINPCSASSELGAEGSPTGLALRLAQRARRARVSVAAVVAPFESRPSAWFAPLGSLRGRDPTESWVILRNLDDMAPGPKSLTMKLAGKRAGQPDVALESESLAGLDGTPWRASTPTELVRDPTGQPPPASGVEALRTRGGPFVGPDIDGVVATLADGLGREVAANYTHIDRNRPRLLYVPIAAFAPDNEDEAQPAVPPPALLAAVLNKAAAESFTHLGLPSRETPGEGLEVVWPAAHQPQALADFAAQDGAVFTKLPAPDEMLAYRAIIIDASIPAGLDRDADLSVGAGLSIRYTGGLAALRDDIGDVESFREGLREYVRRGGTVFLIGSNPMAWDESRVDDRGRALNLVPTLRAACGTEGTDPIFQPAGDRPRRLILVHDDTRSAYAEPNNSKGALLTLPPLAQRGLVRLDELADKIPGRPKVEDLERLWSEQLITWIGIRIGKPILPGTEDVAGFKRDDDRRDIVPIDREFSTLISSVSLDSKAEFAASVLRIVAADFRHPSLLAELQGEALFRRIVPGQHGLPEDWALQEPIPNLASSVGLRWPNLLLDESPASAPGRSELDGVESRAIDQYLVRLAKMGSTGPNPQVLAIIDGDDLGDRGLKTILVDGVAGEAPWESPFRPPASDQQKCFLQMGCGGIDASRDWNRILYMGRGRLARLLIVDLAWRVQDLRASLDLGALGWFCPRARIENYPGTVDLLKVAVDRRLHHSFHPTHVPTPEWIAAAGGKALVRGDTGEPLVIGLRPDGPTGGRVILALLDPDLETRLHGRRYPSDWYDFSPSHAPDETGQASVPLPVLQLSIRDGAIMIDRLETLPTTPRLAVAIGRSAPPELDGVFAYPGLGLRGEEPIAIADHGQIERLSSGLRIRMRAGSQFSNQLRSESRPSLMEIRTRVNGDKISVWFPSSALGVEQGVSMESTGAKPVLQVLDLLLGLMHRSSFDVVYDSDIHGLVVHSEGAVDRPKSFVASASGSPIGRWTPGPSHPGVATPLIPLPQSVAGTRLHTSIDAEGLREEEGIFVPNLGADWRIHLLPAETGSGEPFPSESFLETLTVTTAGRWRIHPGLQPSASAQGVRGLIVTPLRDSQLNSINRFVRAVLEVRFRNRTTRGWYIISGITFIAVLTLARKGRIHS